MLERAKETTRKGEYTHIEYARFADDLVVLIDAHPRNAWLLGAVLQTTAGGVCQATGRNQ